NMILRRIARHQANIEVCKTGLALKIYKEENGTYPETLDFLSEFPIDPFSGKKLIYKKIADSFILYSLGPNMEDDGGISQMEKIIQLQSLQEPIKTPDGRSLKPQVHPNSAKDYDIVWKCEK
ncbi:MAG: hypothetical protein KKH49_05175, partial [Candidatus Omnitrophica bacterium]|nr:hypothetical protein [Candidatus Omnitrophota bacterium]